MSPHYRPANHPRHVFTLIELLVVVAIISILASMLVPSLTKAREAGRKAVCMSNLKNVFFGFENYAEGYDDYVPTAAVQGSTGTSADWHLKLGEAGAWGSPVEYSGLNHNNGKSKNILGWEILRCPSETGTPLANNESYFRWENGRSSYALNISMNYRNSLNQYGSHIPRKGWGRGPTQSRVESSRPIVMSPERAAIVMDIPGNSNIWTTTHFGGHTDNPADPQFTYHQYAFRHNGAANMLHWDGHAESKRHYITTGEYVWQYLNVRLPTTSFPDTTQPDWPQF